MAGGSGEQDLNLVPYMDIMVNLIMFMLIVTAYIVELKEAPVLAPAYTSGGAGSDSKPKPFLTVGITTKSFAILGSTDDIPAQELLIEDGKYPFAELAQVLRKYKSEYPVSENLVLMADSTIPYSVVVATMDAARKDGEGPLFPGVTLGLAVN